MSGRVIESGNLPDGTSYRIWLSADGEMKLCYIGAGTGKRRTIRWIRRKLREVK